MGKVKDYGSQFIRDIFKREKQKSELAVSKNNIQRSNSYGNIDSSRDGSLSDELSLDNRTMYRYVDYEEMDQYSDCSTVLDVCSDDATQVDSLTGKTVWVDCEDEQIKEELTDMFEKRIDIDNHIWEMTRTLVKYGNSYQEIVIGDHGVVDIGHLSTVTMKRVENEKKDLLGFVQSYSSDLNIDPKNFASLITPVGGGVNERGDIVVFEDWRVVHNRLNSKYVDSPYGISVLDPARWIWKRLMLLEDAVLVFKLTRSSSRFAFYVDVGKLGKVEAERALETVMHRLKKKKFLNPKTGKLDLKMSPLAMDEDFFLAVRDGKESTRVESLSGPSYQQVDDVQYFLNKFYAATGVSKSQVGYEDSNGPETKTALSMRDIRFARRELRIQREVRNGLKKICKVNLASLQIDPDSVEFDVRMTVPSSIFELAQMEVYRSRADLATSMQAHVSMYWILKNIYRLDDGDIDEITKQKKTEAPPPEQQGGYESISVPGKVISERELMIGNKEHEKRIEDIVRKKMDDPNSAIGKRLNETAMLLRELVHSRK